VNSGGNSLRLRDLRVRIENDVNSSNVYNGGAWDVFNTILRHLREWVPRISPELSAFHVFYIPSQEEYKENSDVRESTDARVLPPISRPTTKPEVTAVVGTRSNFYFVVADHEEQQKLGLRNLSCHCDVCHSDKWRECKNSEEAGEYSVITMKKSSGGSRNATRSDISTLCDRRRSLARQVQVDEVVAFISKDDPHGNDWWLARAFGPAYRATAELVRSQEMGEGVVLRLGGYYIDVTFFDRFPASQGSIFKPDGQRRTLDAEGLIARLTPLEHGPVGRRATRSNTPSLLLQVTEEATRRIQNIAFDDRQIL
jgi:hypothetical protein